MIASCAQVHAVVSEGIDVFPVQPSLEQEQKDIEVPLEASPLQGSRPDLSVGSHHYQAIVWIYYSVLLVGVALYEKFHYGQIAFAACPDQWSPLLLGL